MNNDRKNSIAFFIASLGMVLCCVTLYYGSGLSNNRGFPIIPLALGVPLAFGVWAFCAMTDPKNYNKSVYDVLAVIIFGSCVFTGMFILTFYK